MVRRWCAGVFLASVWACGPTTPVVQDGGVSPVVPRDAGTVEPRPDSLAFALTGGAATLSAGAWSAQVQVETPASLPRARGGDFTLEGHAVLSP